MRFSLALPSGPPVSAAAAIDVAQMRAKESPHAWQHLSRDLLDRALAAVAEYMLNNQKADGRFNYEYNFETGEMVKDDNQVRQAGALWGLALLHQAQPSKELREGIRKGLQFYAANSTELQENREMIIYPEAEYGRTGTIALTGLALVDVLNSDNELPAADVKTYVYYLQSYINFLLTLQ